MIRRSHRNAALSSFVALAALVAAAAPAQAQLKPFKISGEGVAPLGLPLPGQEARPHWIVGNATHLGLHKGKGTVRTDTAFPQPDGRIIGTFGSGMPFVFVAANGDKLACHYGRADKGASTPGTFQLIPVPALGPGVYRAEFIAEFVPQPGLCTGRFAGVSGKWTMYAATEPFVLGSTQPGRYWWHGEGALLFKQGR